jgi:hypothetical protein
MPTDPATEHGINDSISREVPNSWLPAIGLFQYIIRIGGVIFVNIRSDAKYANLL